MKSILIVGGGSAGWMAAAFLNRTLRSPEADTPIPITVVDSGEVAPIGVGEATTPTLRSFLAALGIPEWQFLLDCEATFKHGIRFLNWRAGDPGNTRDYYHFFENPPVLEGRSALVHWVNLRDRGMEQPALCEAVSVQAPLCRSLKSPKTFNAGPYTSEIPYAYHLDATRLGASLRAIAMERGVAHVRDHVVSVPIDSAGNIAGVVTREHGTLQADLYVDATGFRSLLLGDALGEPFQDWTDYLLCDRAVACQSAHESDPPLLRPYTTSTAMDCGWIWDIDLFSRRGNGYVYSSRHCSPEQAEQTLRRHMGAAGATAQPRHLKMSIGHRRSMWKRNCLAVGLAAGFLEPLESTGIYLIEVALGLFLDHVGGREGAPYLAQRFNSKMGQIYEELRDFIQMHFILSDRADAPFWNDYRNAAKVSDALRYKLDLWSFKLPSVTDLDGSLTLFGPANYAYILAGMDQLAPGVNNLSPYVSPTSSIQALRTIESARQRFLSSYPGHFECVKKLRSVTRSPAAA